MGVFSGGVTGEPSWPAPETAAHSVMLLETRKKCAGPQANNAPVGPATHGGKPVVQVVFPLRDGFHPVSDLAALPAFLQNDKTHFAPIGSGVEVIFAASVSTEPASA